MYIQGFRRAPKIYIISAIYAYIIGGNGLSTALAETELVSIYYNIVALVSPGSPLPLVLILE